MLDMRKYAGSSFIGVEDVRGSSREETIVSIGEGKFDKPVASFESGAKFTLNATNVTTLIRAYGPNDQDCIGCTIELSIGTLKYNGKDQEGVVVQPISPPKPVEARTPVPKTPPDMDDEIPF